MRGYLDKGVGTGLIPPAAIAPGRPPTDGLRKLREAGTRRLKGPGTDPVHHCGQSTCTQIMHRSSLTGIPVVPIESRK